MAVPTAIARKTARTKPCAEVAGRSLTWRTWRTWRLCGEFRRLSDGRVDAEMFVLAYARPQDPIVLVLSPPWRTVLVLVIERFA